MSEENIANQTVETPPAPDPAATAPAQDQAPPQGDIRQNALDLLTSLGYSNPEKPKPEEKPKDETEDAKPATDGSKPAKSDAKPDVLDAKVDSEDAKTDDKAGKKRKVVSKPKVDTDTIGEIVDRTARSVAQELRRASAADAKPAEPAPAQDFQPTPAEQRDIEVFAEMADDPKYKGIDSQFKSFLKVKKAYQDRWESSHPDEEFDIESEEHQPFLDKHLPKYDEADFDDAKVSMRAKQITKAELEKRDKEQARREAQKNVSSKIETASASASMRLVGGIDQSLAKAFESPEGIKQLRESSPVLGYVIDNHVGNLRAEVDELMKLSQPGLEYRPIPGHPIHEALSKVAIETETAIKRMPSTQRLNDGKDFATLQEWVKMTPEEREHHWILTSDDLVHVLTAKRVAQAKQDIANLKISVPAPASNATPDKEEETEPEPKPVSAKPTPPTTTANVETLNTPGSTASQAKTLTDDIVKSLWS